MELQHDSPASNANAPRSAVHHQARTGQAPDLRNGRSTLGSRTQPRDLRALTSRALERVRRDGREKQRRRGEKPLRAVLAFTVPTATPTLRPWHTIDGCRKPIGESARGRAPALLFSRDAVPIAHHTSPRPPFDQALGTGPQEHAADLAGQALRHARTGASVRPPDMVRPPDLVRLVRVGLVVQRGVEPGSLAPCPPKC